MKRKNEACPQEDIVGFARFFALDSVLHRCPGADSCGSTRLPADERGGLSSFLIWFLVAGNLYVFIVLLIFIALLHKMKGINNREKWLWRGLMFFGHVIAIPAFWYFCIWKCDRT
jgi:hypothetical protein